MPCILKNPQTKEPKIISADRMDGGVHVAFSDGEEAFYSQELLYRMLGEAKQTPQRVEDEY